MNFASLISCLINSILGCPPDWLTGIDGAIRGSDEDDEIDDSFDRLTNRS
jgi:hypothetical protein